ncbi:MAG: response regulator [Rickettsiales bacterium]|jgi:CheY-like chemotaxis protein/DNA-binding XRE family transcriptional regulator|nr:response regulator [Rickettsiales bacterium]
MKALERKKQEELLSGFVGKRIRKQRVKLGMSQESLAQIMGCSYQLVQKQESGASRIHANTLFEIAKILGVELSYFYDGYLQQNSCQSRLPSDGSIIGNVVKKSWNILLIEDSPEDEFLLRNALGKLKVKQTFNVKTCYDGLEGSSYLKGIGVGNVPDLIFLDLNIPKKDGFELLREFKKNRSLAFIPIIIMTNSVNAQEMLDCYRLYASGYVTKSFELEKFEQKILSVIQYWTMSVVTPRNY